MRNFKRIAAAAISATMLFSTMSLNAFAVTVDEAQAMTAVDFTTSDSMVASLDASTLKVAKGESFDLVVNVKDSADKVVNVAGFAVSIAYDTANMTMSYAPNLDDISYSQGRNWVYFALDPEQFNPNNGSGKAILGSVPTAPYKLIPTHDFAVINVKVGEDAPVGPSTFTITEVATITADGSTVPNTTPVSLVVNVVEAGESTPTEAPTEDVTPTATPDVEVPTATPDAEVPTATPDAEVPTATPDAEVPTATPDVEEPETGISITKPSIKAGKDFSVTVTRPNGTNAGKATVTITDAEGNPIGEPVTVEIPENETKTKVELGALPNVAKGDKVTISVTYYEGDVEVGTDSETVTVKSATSGGTSATTPVVGGGSGSSKPAATTEPTATEDPTATTNPEATTEPSDVTVPSTDSIFVDVPVQAAWAEADINTLAKAGIVNGVSATEFAPNANVTREQFVKMIVGALGLDLVDSAVAFNDVETGAYYVPYIATAVKNGIVTGMSDEWFGVGENITREDMATILYRALKLNGTNVPAFSDAADIAGYAQPAVAELASLGVITGYKEGTFLPKKNATRAEAAVVINRVLNIIAADDEEVVEDVVADEATEEVAEDATEETTTEVE